MNLTSKGHTIMPPIERKIVLDLIEEELAHDAEGRTFLPLGNFLELTVRDALRLRTADRPLYERTMAAAGLREPVVA